MNDLSERYRALGLAIDSEEFPEWDADLLVTRDRLLEFHALARRLLLPSLKQTYTLRQGQQVEALLVELAECRDNQLRG